MNVEEELKKRKEKMQRYFDAILRNYCTVRKSLQSHSVPRYTIKE